VSALIVVCCFRFCRWRLCRSCVFFDGGGVDVDQHALLPFGEPGLAIGLITVVGRVSQLGGTTALLLLAVFTVVNICCLVLRRDPQAHKHFVAPTALPVLGALSCAYLVGPWTGRDPSQYAIAGVLLGIGIVLWLVTWFINRSVYGHGTILEHPEALEGVETHEEPSDTTTPSHRHP